MKVLSHLVELSTICVIPYDNWCFRSPNFWDFTCTYTKDKAGSSSPWWGVDLGAVYSIHYVRVYIRQEYGKDILLYINTIHMYSGITSGRVLNGELLYTKILEVNLFAFAYRLFRRDFSPLDGTYCNMSHRVGRNLYETVCRRMQTN